jgi:hypothetical protein
MNLPSIRVKARKCAHRTQTFIRHTLKALVGAYAALFAVAFPVAPFFDEALCACSNSARFNAQRRFVASMILFLPAALSLRLRFGASDVTACKEGADCSLVSAHRFRCASAIRFGLAALILSRLRFGGSAAADLVCPPFNIALSSRICASSRFF